MEEIDAKILEPVADKLKIKKSSLPKLLIFWGVFGIVLNIFWLINSLYPLPRLLSLDTEPSFWWQYVLYILFIILSAMELVYGLKLNRQEKQLRKNQRFNALFLLLFPLFLSILLSPLSVISTLHFFAPKKPVVQKPLQESAKPDPTAEWKIYTNTQYGFEIKHPSLNINKCSAGMGEEFTDIVVFTKGMGRADSEYCGEYVISISKGRYYKNFDQLIKNITLSLEYVDIKQKDQIVTQEFLGQLRVTKLQYKDSPYTYYLFNDLKNTSTYIIDILSKPSDAKEINQILSTFKFINSQTVDFANWKTYTNTQYGFEFKYPQNFSEKSTLDVDVAGVQNPVVSLAEPMATGFIMTGGIYANAGSMSPQQFIKTFFNKNNTDAIGNPIDPELKNITFTNQVLNGNSVTMIQGLQTVRGALGPAAIITKDDNTFFFISEDSSEDETQILDQILSTFRFTQ